MIELDGAEVSKTIQARERRSALIPIFLLRWLSNLDLDSAQRAYCLLAYADCGDLCELLRPEKDIDELREKLAAGLSAAEGEGDTTTRIYFSSDLWKLVRLATGELSWREFCVFGGLQSVIGQSKYKRMTRETISARAAGFATFSIAKGHSSLMPVHQITRTLDKLEERGLVLRYRAGRRTVYYGRWDMKPAEFKSLMKNLWLKKQNRKRLTEEINEEIKQETEHLHRTERSEAIKRPRQSVAAKKILRHESAPSPPTASTRDSLRSSATSNTSTRPRLREEGFKPINEWLRELGPRILEEQDSLERVKEGNQYLYRPKQP